MSAGARGTGRSRTARTAPESAAGDVWWDLDATESFAIDGAIAPQVRAVVSTRRATRVRRPASLLVRVLTAPLRLLVRWARTSARVRRAGIRAVVFLCMFAIVAGSVGVILLNNVVISRTAELGRLDDDRRELRTANALLGAEAARRSATPVIIKRAANDLGMVKPTSMPTFMYLDRESRTLTPAERAKVARAEILRRQRVTLAAQRVATAERTAAAAAQPVTKE